MNMIKIILIASNFHQSILTLNQDLALQFDLLSVFFQNYNSNSITKMYLCLDM